MELYAGLSERIGILGEQLKGEHSQNIERLDSHFKLIIEKLKPLDEIEKLRAEVDEHSKKLSFYRGCLAVLAFLWTGALGFFGVHRH